MSDPIAVVMIGPEGCGSSALKTSLQAVPNVCVMGDLIYTKKFFADDLRAVVDAVQHPTREKVERLSKISRTILQLWYAERVLGDRHGDVALHELARRRFSAAYEVLIDHVARQAGPLSHVVTKFSQPYSMGGVPKGHPLATLPEVLDAPHDSHFLDILDLPWPFETHRLVVLRRDPRECAYSQLRRGFYPNIRVAAKWTEIGLNHICAQIKARNAPFFVIDYVSFDQHYELSEHLGNFLSMDAQALSHAFSQSEIRSPSGEPLWKTRLSEGDAEFLQQFFGPKRMRQWDLLFSAPTLRPSNAG